MNMPLPASGNPHEPAAAPALLRAVIESAPIAMVMIDRRGGIVLVNAETEKLFGYARNAMIGQPLEILIPARFRNRHPQMRERFFAAPEARRMGLGRDLRGIRRDGSEFPVEIGLNPVETSEGVFVLSAIVDISERKRAEAIQSRLAEELERRVLERTAALKQSNEALERSNVELQQFAFIASHDLQTPLRGIAGCAQLLETRHRDAIGEDGASLVRRIVGGTVQLQSMIKDLLAYSRVDSLERPFERVAMNEVFYAAADLLAASIAESGARLTHDPLPAVTGDRALLVQLLFNLVGNALKYRGAEPPRIHVSAIREDGENVISVRDNGIGVAPEYHERIFELFRRLHTQQAYPGTGIGLAICRRVVHRHGGRIWVESDPGAGAGSTFHFTLRDPA